MWPKDATEPGRISFLKNKKVTRGGFYFFTFNPVWNMSILKFLKIIRERERQTAGREEEREKRKETVSYR